MKCFWIKTVCISLLDRPFREDEDLRASAMLGKNKNVSNASFGQKDDINEGMIGWGFSDISTSPWVEAYGIHCGNLLLYFTFIYLLVGSNI